MPPTMALLFYSCLFTDFTNPDFVLRLWENAKLQLSQRIGSPHPEELGRCGEEGEVGLDRWLRVSVNPVDGRAFTARASEKENNATALWLQCVCSWVLSTTSSCLKRWRQIWLAKFKKYRLINTFSLPKQKGQKSFWNSVLGDHCLINKKQVQTELVVYWQR